MLFGYGDRNGAHFDALLADILHELDNSYVSDFEEDLQKTDIIGYTVAQSDTSLTTEVNLALALRNYDGVESVDFETVWGQKHVKAERTGDSTTNFIAWVNECMKQ